jgi:hypothetical protein
MHKLILILLVATALSVPAATIDTSIGSGNPTLTSGSPFTGPFHGCCPYAAVGQDFLPLGAQLDAITLYPQLAVAGEVWMALYNGLTAVPIFVSPHVSLPGDNAVHQTVFPVGIAMDELAGYAVLLFTDTPGGSYEYINANNYGPLGGSSRTIRWANSTSSEIVDQWFGQDNLDVHVQIEFSGAFPPPDPTPEPFSMVLSGAGLLGIGLLRRHQRKVK